ncbi:MAG: non-ribosomal peptide synthetase [Methanoregula sp.]|jgi:acyl-CoA synthetase (AMP-forming)/AMP-acid ligase II/thioesterase domain-containing protein/acyl carrier protein
MKNEKSLCVRDLIIFGSQNPDSPAIESPGYQPLTFRDLRRQVAYAVRSLNALGFRPNDRIAVVMPNGPHTAVAILAVMAGFTVIPLNSQNKEPEYDSVFSHLGIKAVLVQKGKYTAAIAVAEAQKIRVIEVSCSGEIAGLFTIIPEVDTGGTEAIYATPKDIAAIKLTSGTSAKPKAVPTSQQRFFAGMHMLNASSGISNTDKNLHFLSLDTGFGYEPPLGGTLLTGGTLVCLQDFVPSDFLDLLSTYRPTHYWGGPAHHQAILQELKKVPRDQLANHSLRLIISGSAAIRPAIIQEMEALLGVRVIDIYVMSEAYISINNPGKQGSVGIPFISELEIWDDEGHALPRGHAGEIVVRGELVFDGYLNAPEENAAAFSNGWFMTGDLGHLDDEGYLFLIGRKKEMINKGGRKIAPAEIDAVLLSHPVVSDAMAFRIPDPTLGEDIATMVVRNDTQVSEEDLRQYCLDRLVQFKVPRRVFFVDEIPKNALGKPLRDEGTKTFGNTAVSENGKNGPAGDEVRIMPSTTEEKLLQIWKGILDLPDITLNDDFFQCGGNSLTAIELLIKIHREFHINLPPDTIYRYPTIQEQATLIRQKTDAKKEYHSLIFPLREGGSLPPLFCIHPLGGWMDHYLKILPAVDNSRPVFGIRGRGLEPGEKLPTTVEETARQQVDAVRTVQKEGPYHLLGFSNGGTIAFELGCQLQELNETVAFLGMIDVTAPATEVRYIKTMAATLFPGRILGTIPAFFERHLKAHPDSRLYAAVLKSIRTVFHKVLFRSGAKSLPESVSEAHASAHFKKDSLEKYPEGSRQNMRVQLNASRMYLPHTFKGDLVLFSTGPDPILFPGDITRGWSSIITGKCEVITVPGDHSNLFNEPYLSVLTEKIREALGAYR